MYVYTYIYVYKMFIFLTVKETLTPQHDVPIILFQPNW